MRKSLRSRPLLIIIILFISLALALAGQQTEQVDKLFAEWDKPDSPGCALAIVKDGQIIYERGYGMANLELNVPITPKTVFYIGSCSKQFVAFCVALLARQGKLSLDDDIRKYIPEMPDYATPITIRHLIHHTSGLRDYLTLENIAGIPFGYFHQQDTLELIAHQKELNFKPGDEYLYSNSGYFILAEIVERISGKSFREFAEEKIFKPLRMKNSHFHDDYARIIKNRASGYFPAGKNKYKNFISTFDCVGSGGLYTSVEDLFLWDQNFYHHKVGGKDLIQMIQTAGTLNNGQKLKYAFGLTIDSYKGLKTVSHGGALGGYRAGMIRFPKQRFSVICLSNLGSFNPMKLGQKVADIYLADKFKEEKTEAEVRSQEKVIYIKLPEKKLKEKTGSYLDRKTGDIRTIIFKNGQLILEALGQKLELAALSDSEFQALKAPIRVLIKFEKQTEGKPLLMHIYPEEQNPETFEAVQLATPTPEQLREYKGDYYSHELQVTFKLVLKDDKLYFTHKNAPRNPLKPTLKDMFTAGGFKINFIRNKDKKVSAFTLNAGRVRNLRFEKRS